MKEKPKYILLTILFMLGITINHIAVQKLLTGDNAVWIYDLSLIWLIIFFFIVIILTSTSDKSDANIDKYPDHSDYNRC
jgi:hypothetical protein